VRVGSLASGRPPVPLKLPMMKLPMTVALRHPDSDLRPALDREPHLPKPYARQRIASSYEHVAGILEECPGVEFETAFDAGCGAGLESFGLAAQFDRVVAVDRSWRAIREARATARRAGISRIVFERGDVESYRTPSPFSFVFSNLMSHNAGSRRTLLGALTGGLCDGGWLCYSEVCEGYGPMEVHRAISERDAGALRERLRQILAGCTGERRFRFYLAGTAIPVLERLGFEVARSAATHCNGAVTVAQHWCRLDARREELGDDPDYATPDQLLEDVRVKSRRLAAERSRGALAPRRHAEVERWVRESTNRLSPLLLYVLMADVALRSFDPRASAVERVARRAPGRLRGSEPDWSRLRDLDAAAIELVAELHGTRPVDGGEAI